MSLPTDTILGDEEKAQVQDIVLAQDENEQFPDGGTHAWLVVVGSYLVLFSTFGVVNSYVRIDLCNFSYVQQLISVTSYRPYTR